MKQKRLAKTALVPCIVSDAGGSISAEEDSLAENVARRYGLCQAEEVTDLRTSVGAAARIAAIDRRVAEILGRWEF